VKGRGETAVCLLLSVTVLSAQGSRHSGGEEGDTQTHRQKDRQTDRRNTPGRQVRVSEGERVRRHAGRESDRQASPHLSQSAIYAHLPRPDQSVDR